MTDNRSTRRARRARALELASAAAAACYDYTDAGDLVKVTDPRAVAVLRRAFAMVLRTGQPVTLELSEGEASAFPRWTQADAGLSHMLAASVDVQGRCAYALRSAAVVDTDTGVRDPQASAALAEAKARVGLVRGCAFGGFPINETRGRA